ncbi:MAG: hypothetical protein ACLTC4_14125 [Hungatella hathewayi]
MSVSSVISMSTICIAMFSGDSLGGLSLGIAGDGGRRAYGAGQRDRRVQVPDSAMIITISTQAFLKASA